MLTTPDFTEITAAAEIRTSTHGNRAKCLQRLVRLDLPVPRTVALSFDTVRAIAAGRLPDMQSLIGVFGPGALLSVMVTVEGVASKLAPSASVMATVNVSPGSCT